MIYTNLSIIEAKELIEALCEDVKWYDDEINEWQATIHPWVYDDGDKYRIKTNKLNYFKKIKNRS